MNIYVVSPITARCEIKLMSHVSNWFIDHSNAIPWIGEAEDSIIGSFKLTKHDTLLDRYHLMLLFSNCIEVPELKTDLLKQLTDGRDGIKKPFTGYDVITLLIRNYPIDYKREPSFYNRDFAAYIDYDKNDISVLIQNGKHIKGVLDKKSIGKGAENSMFHIFNSEYGPQIALDMIYNLQQIAIDYIYNVGVTIGINDFIISDEALHKIHEIESSIIKKANLITDRLNNGELIAPIGKTTEEFYEDLMVNELRIMDDFSQPILSSINFNTNQLLQGVLSGSKGKIENIYHIASAIGQIIINGQRIRQNYTYKRTLPYFPRHDTAPESRGYITNSYISGMTLPETIFNTMNARFDLISKALSTATTGDLTRKSIKNLETLIVKNNWMCVKGNNIIQFLYGEDGFDTRFIEKVKIPTIMLNNADLESKFKYVGQNDKLNNVFNAEFTRIRDDRDYYRTLFLKIEAINVKELLSDSRMMPINVERYLRAVENKFPDTKPSETELADMVELVYDFTEKHLPYFYLNEIQEKRQSKLPIHILTSTTFMKIYIRSILCARNMQKINLVLLRSIFDIIRIKFISALVDYGSAIGVIAAQSFGGPLTQYMLDSHKRAATGGTSRTEVNKAKELLGARSTEARTNNSMLITLLPHIEKNKKHVIKIANSIETMKLNQFVSVYQIFFEKYGEPVHSKYKHEKAIIDEFQKYNKILQKPSDLVDWCIRFVLNKMTMIHKNMQLETIIEKLRYEYPMLYIVYTPENSEQIVLRIYIRRGYYKNNIISFKATQDLGELLMDTIIRGVEGIVSVNVVELIRHTIKPDGSLVRATGPDVRYGIQTVGTNIAGLALVDGVDVNKIMSDSPIELYEFLGIEASRMRIKTEIHSVGESSVCTKIFTVYADEMSYTGKITSIERGGLSIREVNNVMLRIGFASPIGTLEEAGINAMEDNIQGITAPILIGATPKIGTAYNDFYMNIKYIENNTKSANDILDI